MRFYVFLTLCQYICIYWPKSPNSEIPRYLLCCWSPDPQPFWPLPALREPSEVSMSSHIGKSDPLYANLNSESNPDLKSNLYAWVPLHLNTAAWRCGLILLPQDIDACRIWPWLTAFCVCFCASWVSFIKIKLLDSKECCWSYLIKRSCKAGDVFPPLCCQQRHLLRESSIQTVTASMPGCCLLGGQILCWCKAATMQKFWSAGKHTPLYLILGMELLSNLPQTHASKLAVMRLITSELLVQPSRWRKADAGHSTDHQLRWGKLAPIKEQTHWQPLHTAGRRAWH